MATDSNSTESLQVTSTEVEVEETEPPEYSSEFDDWWSTLGAKTYIPKFQTRTKFTFPKPLSTDPTEEEIRHSVLKQQRMVAKFFNLPMPTDPALEHLESQISTYEKLASEDTLAYHEMISETNRTMKKNEKTLFEYQEQHQELIKKLKVALEKESEKQAEEEEENKKRSNYNRFLNDLPSIPMRAPMGQSPMPSQPTSSTPSPGLIPNRSHIPRRAFPNILAVSSSPHFDHNSNPNITIPRHSLSTNITPIPSIHPPPPLTSGSSDDLSRIPTIPRAVPRIPHLLPPGQNAHIPPSPPNSHIGHSPRGYPHHHSIMRGSHRGPSRIPRGSRSLQNMSPRNLSHNAPTHRIQHGLNSPRISGPGHPPGPGPGQGQISNHPSHSGPPPLHSHAIHRGSKNINRASPRSSPHPRPRGNLPHRGSFRGSPRLKQMAASPIPRRPPGPSINSDNLHSPPRGMPMQRGGPRGSSRGSPYRGPSSRGQFRSKSNYPPRRPPNRYPGRNFPRKRHPRRGGFN